MRLISDEAWATLTIWSESRSEPQAGRIAVAEVIRNRTRLRVHSAGTVSSTVLRAYQFSCWNTKDPNRLVAALLDDADPIVRACREAWHAAEHGGSDSTRGALFYYNPAVVPTPPDWVAECELTCRIGRHVFYRPK